MLISTPVVLWASWVFARAASSDLLIRDNSQLLLAWGAGITALAASQMVCRSQRLLPLREAVLTLALIATIGVAGVYAYGAIRAHAGARATSQEQAFARYGISGRGPFRHMVSSHQRADGTDVETGRVEQPLAYSQICERVQRLDGDYGFSWVHVLDRSLPPAHEIAWPIRREDCFSNKPVSSLRG